MPTEADILEALRPVQDPELYRSIVDLGMVKGIRIDAGPRGVTVGVTVALTVAGCPLRAEITQRVTAAVQPVEGVDQVDVELTVMTDEERAAVRGQLQASQPPPGPPQGDHGHAAAAIPFGEGSRTRVLGLSSGKGGVGKSSVTVNLAVALSRLGHEVAVLDADVYGFSIPRMLGITQEPVVIDGMIVPPVAADLKVISTGFFVPDDQAVIWRGPMLHKALEQFLTDVLWGEPDFLLVDMPPGTGDVALSMAQFLPRAEVLVVTTPQPAAQRVAQRSALMARKVKLPVRGVVENMSWFTGDDGKRYEIFGSGGGQLLADDLGVPLLARIPLVTALREGGDEGRPITLTDPGSEAALAFEALAQAVESMGPSRIYKSELKIG
ncbi:MAG: ATP-binding protein involved in chromosome partitioning [Actinomycetota bacterium]|jgi:ATP-binding protein involved in chromosome partitioning|nr:ATP-binding protein involved in chromosome partitioning [Actinomycetota bacterium]